MNETIRPFDVTNKLSGLFSELSPEGEERFRKWARENYTPLEEIKEIWHPVIQDECKHMNHEQHLKKTEL